MSAEWFRLEAVLRFRRLQRDKARSAYAAANAEVRKAQAARDRARAEMQGEHANLRADADGLVSASRLLRHRAKLLAAEGELESIMRLLLVAQEKAAARGRDLLEAHRRSQAVQVLKERARALHTRSRARLQRREIEDAVVRGKRRV